MLTAQESQAEGPVFLIRNRLEQLDVEVEDTKGHTDEEMMTKLTYKHMLDRMKKDHIATKIKSAELDTSLKSKSQILDLENHK